MALDTGSFNPRSHEGSDRLSLSGGGWSGCFNPRSHEGSDPDWILYKQGRCVSIHAPTKGATSSGINDLSCLVFQSTLPRRERQLPRYNHTAGRLFQSTLPRRERQHHSLNQIFVSLFQSTLPRRERLGVARYNHSYSQGFNPRSHEGSDVGEENKRYYKTGFNPRSHEGSDFRREYSKKQLTGFNPCSHEGSDKRF